MKKDVLILAHRIPYPPNKGDKIRTYHMVKHLALHYRVTLVCLIDDPEDCRHIPALEQMVHKLHYQVRTSKVMQMYAITSLLRRRSFSQQCFYSKKLQQIVDTYLEAQDPAAILCFCSSMADYIFRSSHGPERFLPPCCLTISLMSILKSGCNMRKKETVNALVVSTGRSFVTHI